MLELFDHYLLILMFEYSDPKKKFDKDKIEIFDYITKKQLFCLIALASMNTDMLQTVW